MFDDCRDFMDKWDIADMELCDSLFGLNEFEDDDDWMDCDDEGELNLCEVWEE